MFLNSSDTVHFWLIDCRLQFPQAPPYQPGYRMQSCTRVKLRFLFNSESANGKDSQPLQTFRAGFLLQSAARLYHDCLEERSGQLKARRCKILVFMPQTDQLPFWICFELLVVVDRAGRLAELKHDIKKTILEKREPVRTCS